MHREQNAIQMAQQIPVRADMPDFDQNENPDFNLNAELEQRLSNDMPFTPVERQTMSNSKVFSMSDTAFENSNVGQEITEYIEVTEEHEILQPKDDPQ